MDILQPLIQSLLSPMVLAFALGVFATLVKSDLKFPDEIYSALTIYLLFAIGVKGGAKLDGVSLVELLRPGMVAIGLSLLIPVWCFYILHKLGKLDGINAAAIAAHYGSVSAVTFGEAVAFLEIMSISFEAFMPALLAVMEVPAIILALVLARRSVPVTAGQHGWGKILHELLTSKGIILLMGGMAIGLLSGEKGYTQIAPLFDEPFRGVLTFFLLEVGLVTGRRLYDLKKVGPFLAVFGMVMPALHGLLGVWLGQWAGLSIGGATILGTLAASASYIAAPAAVRVALPQANPSLYLTSSLAITFPFNVVFGIPLYYMFAKWIFGAA